MTYASEVLADSPLAYYRLGDASGTTMTDSSGNGRDGTYVNSPTLGATGLLVGDADTAASFDAANDRGETAYGAWMDSSTALTVEALIRPNVHSSGVWRPIVDRDKSGGRTFIFGILNSKVRFIKTGGTGGEVQADSTTTLTQNGTVTYHVVATYDGSNIRIYIDGTLEVTQAASGNLGTGNSPFLVGASYLGDSSPAAIFGGTIDEAAIYGSVLSGARIAAHYAAATASGTTVSGEAFASAATLLDGTALTAVRVAGEAWASGATFLDGGGFPLVEAGQPFAATATMLDGTAQTQLLISGDAWATTTTMLDGGVTGAPVSGDAWAATATFLDGSILYATDTSNALDGRSRHGRGTATRTVPVAAPPAGMSLGTLVDKALAYPAPTMDEGRPT